MIHALVLGLVMVIMLGTALVRPFVGLIAFDLISFMNPQQEAWGIGAHIHWALLAAIATAIGCVVAGEPKKLPVNAFTVLVAIFLILISISTVFALGPADLVNKHYFLVVKSFGFMILACGLLTTRKRIHALIWLMVLSVGYYGMKGGLFTILHGGHHHVIGPPNSMLHDNNELAVGLLITLPLMNYLRLHSAHKLTRIGLVGAMTLTLLAVVGTYSRGGLLALFAMGVFFWWNSRAKLAYAVLFVLGAGMIATVMPPKWTERMVSIQHYRHDTDAVERLTIWREALGIAEARPFVGGGFDATTYPEVLHQFYPGANPLAVHSIWFEVAGDAGFPALFVWSLMQVVGILNARKLRRYARGDPELDWVDDLGRMTEASIVAFLVGGSFLPQSYFNYYFAVLVVLASTRMLIIRRSPHLAHADIAGRPAAPQANRRSLSRRAISRPGFVR